MLEQLRSRAPGDWPGLLICDIALGEHEDGYSVLRALREFEAERGIALDQRLPAIALTGFAGVESRVEALLAGFQLHMAKPVEPQELVVAAAGLAIRRLAAA